MWREQHCSLRELNGGNSHTSIYALPTNNNINLNHIGILANAQENFNYLEYTNAKGKEDKGLIKEEYKEKYSTNI